MPARHDPASRLRRRIAAVLLVLAPLCAIAATPVRAAGLIVFAAASLTDAMKDIDALWHAHGDDPMRFSFAASSTLARQIEQGADANVFASADEQWMDYAQKHDLIAPDTRRSLLGNTLVLVMPKDHVHPITIDAHTDLLGLLGPTGRIATGDPSNVPVGLYARQALTRLGLWDAIQPRLAAAESVRAALLLVERGEAPMGIVYATDAAVAPDVAIAGQFPEASHDPIRYPFAVTRRGDTPEARALLTFLAGPEAGAVFLRRGFTLVPQ